MTRTTASVTTVLAIAAFSGALFALFPRPSRNLDLLLTFGPQMAVLAVLFWWLSADSPNYGFRRSALLNIGLVALTIVFLPVYLFRSRPEGQRLAAIAKALGLMLLYLLVTVLTVVIVGEIGIAMR